MSEWILPKPDDIDTNDKKTEIHIWFESDDFGNRYLSIEGEALQHLKRIIRDFPP